MRFISGPKLIDQPSRKFCSRLLSVARSLAGTLALRAALGLHLLARRLRRTLGLRRDAFRENSIAPPLDSPFEATIVRESIPQHSAPACKLFAT